MDKDRPNIDSREPFIGLYPCGCHLIPIELQLLGVVCDMCKHMDEIEQEAYNQELQEAAIEQTIS